MKIQFNNYEKKNKAHLTGFKLCVKQMIYLYVLKKYV